MKQFATTSEVGAVYGPVFENDKYRMFKLVDKTVAPDSVKLATSCWPVNLRLRQLLWLIA